MGLQIVTINGQYWGYRVGQSMDKSELQVGTIKEDSGGIKDWNNQWTVLGLQVGTINGQE